MVIQEHVVGLAGTGFESRSLYAGGASLNFSDFNAIVQAANG